MSNKLERLRAIEREDTVVLIDPVVKGWIKIKKSLYDEYKNGNTTRLSKVVNKYFIEENEDEMETLNLNTVYFTVTRRCNLECSFCSMRSNPYVDISEDISLETIKKKIIPILKSININKIVITGGEPVTRKDLLDLIDLIHKELDVSIIFQTNGLMLTEDIISKLEGKVRQIDISIENIFEDINLTKKMKKNFDLIKKYNLILYFSFVIDRENKKYLEKAIDLIYRYNAKSSLKFVSGMGFALDNNLKQFSSKETLKIYHEIVKYIITKKYYKQNLIDIFGISLQVKSTCSANGRCLSIYPNGDLFMCHSLNVDEFALGNIKNTTANQLFEVVKMKTNNKEIKQKLDVDFIEECQGCELKYLCQGPCAAERYHGEINLKNCELLKLLFEYSLFEYRQEFTIEKNLSILDELFLKCIKEKSVC